MNRPIGWIVVVTLLVLTLGWPQSVVGAEDPAPPLLGETVLEDDLSGPTVIQPVTCPTGRSQRDFVGEGLRFKLTGRCRDSDTATSLWLDIGGLSMTDGEVRLEFKVFSGIDRAIVQLGSRLQPATPSGAPLRESYYVFFEPGRSRVAMGKTGQSSLWADRHDLGTLISADAWNSVSLRLQGPNIWMLVNDEPALFFADPSLDRGQVYLQLLRRSTTGHPVFDDDPNDTTEVAVVARNLKVSALADGDPARMPIYQRP